MNNKLIALLIMIAILIVGYVSFITIDNYVTNRDVNENNQFDNSTNETMNKTEFNNFMKNVENESLNQKDPKPKIPNLYDVYSNNTTEND